MLSPPAGLSADLWDKRRIPLCAQFAAAVLVAVAGTVVQVRLGIIGRLLMMTLFSGVRFVVYFPIRQAAIPTAVGFHHLLNADTFARTVAHVIPFEGPPTARGLVMSSNRKVASTCRATSSVLEFL